MTTLTGRDPATGAGIALTLADGCIAAVESRPEADGPWLARGFTDLQVNGLAGIDLNTGHVTPPEVEALSLALARLGVARWLPTMTKRR